MFSMQPKPPACQTLQIRSTQPHSSSRRGGLVLDPVGEQRRRARAQRVADEDEAIARVLVAHLAHLAVCGGVCLVVMGLTLHDLGGPKQHAAPPRPPNPSPAPDPPTHPTVGSSFSAHHSAAASLVPLPPYTPRGQAARSGLPTQPLNPDPTPTHLGQLILSKPLGRLEHTPVRKAAAARGRRGGLEWDFEKKQAGLGAPREVTRGKRARARAAARRCRWWRRTRSPVRRARGARVCEHVAQVAGAAEAPASDSGGAEGGEGR